MTIRCNGKNGPWQESVLQGLEYCSSETIVFQRFTIKVWSRMHRILSEKAVWGRLGSIFGLQRQLDQQAIISEDVFTFLPVKSPREVIFMNYSGNSTDSGISSHKLIYCI